MRSPRQIPALLVASGFLQLCIACGTSKPVERPVRGSTVVNLREPPPVLKAAAVGDLYAADDALRDVLSGELEFLGTGPWPTVERSSACAFRNARVIVVNTYCTLTETPAFRIDVYSPQRGRVRIYGEASGQFSKRKRSDYFTFMVESEPPAGPQARFPAVALTMSYQELRSYEQQRYDAFLPGCFGGEQHQRNLGGCLGTLTPRQSQWAARNRSFLDHANDDWYRVIHQMRVLSLRHGSDPD